MPDELSFIEYVNAVDDQLRPHGASVMQDGIDWADIDSAQTAGETPEECALFLLRNKRHTLTQYHPPSRPPWAHGRKSTMLNPQS